MTDPGQLVAIGREIYGVNPSATLKTIPKFKFRANCIVRLLQDFCHGQLVVSSLDSRRHLLGKINELGTIFSTRQLFYSQNGQITDVTEKKNVPITFILPSRWQDEVESLGIETTGCLCFWPYRLYL